MSLHEFCLYNHIQTSRLRNIFVRTESSGAGKVDILNVAIFWDAVTYSLVDIDRSQWPLPPRRDEGGCNFL
jgi:hypothetical protein